MKINITYIAWGLIALFSIIILINAQTIKHQVLNSIDKHGLLKNPLSSNYNNNLQEGFSFGKTSETDIDEIIRIKTKSITSELGEKSGVHEIKTTLESLKKLCSLESVKCMTNIIGNNTNTKTINIDKLAKQLKEEREDPDCNKYREYTELSKELQNIIDNI